MNVTESRDYSSMMVREFCYLFDMHKEDYEPTSDIEAVLYELEYGYDEGRKITQACSTESQVEYTINCVYSSFKYVVGYYRDNGVVYVQIHVLPQQHSSLSRWIEGENSLERIAALAVLEYCASRVA